MLETLIAKLAQRVLQDYFILGTATPDTQPPTPSNSTSNSFSSSSSNMGGCSLQWHNLQVQPNVFNDKFLAKHNLPMQLIHGQVQSLQVTLPWSTAVTAKTAGRRRRSASSSNSGGGSGWFESENDSEGDIIIVLNGVSLLFTMEYSYNDAVIRSKHAKERREKLQKATRRMAAVNSSTSTGSLVNSEHVSTAADASNTNPNTHDASTASSSSSSSSWKEYFKERLRDGLLPAVADRVQIHILNMHVRVEDVNSSPANPFAYGITLESLHLVQFDDTTPAATTTTTTTTDDEKDQQQQQQQGQEKSALSSPSNVTNEPDGLIRKTAQMKQFSMYWNALEENHVTVEHNILHQLSTPGLMMEAMSEAWMRHVRNRSVSTAAATNTSSSSALPAHTYLLLPVDGSLDLTLTPPKIQQELPDQPVITLRCHIPNVHFSIRDFQCSQIYRMFLCYKEHKHVFQYRHLRPTVTCMEDPRAYWKYACLAIQYQLKEHKLRWCRGRFRRGLDMRRRYCDLYARKLASTSPDDAAGPADGGAMVRRNLTPLSIEEKKELQDMEDGFIGSLSIEDITLYRILVERRIGITAVVVEMPVAARPARSWFGRSTQSNSNGAGDDEEEKEYQKLVAYWQELAATAGSNQEARSLIVLALEVVVDSGKLALFSPLSSTDDQPELRRLQQLYLVFHYDSFSFGFNLMRDFKSMAINVSLNDFVATETRSDQKEYRVITREAESMHVLPLIPHDGNEYEASDRPPLVSFLFTKNPPAEGDFDMGIQARLYPIRMVLVPECEWIRRTKVLIRPLPQFKKASSFWNDLSMARINSWASQRLGLLAKASSASDHSNIDLLIDLDCPIIEIGDGEGSELIVNLGRAHLHTKKLASVADAMMMPVPPGHKSSKHLHSGASVRFDQASVALSRDDVSVGTPIRLRLPQSPAFRASVTKSTAGSVRFDESVKLGSIGDYFQQAASFHENNDDKNSFFYDTYELQYTPGGLAVETPYGRENVLCPMDIHVTIHKSILPSDHTLCKLKFRCTIEEIAITLSDSITTQLVQVVRKWKAVVSCSVPVSARQHNFGIGELIEEENESDPIADDLVSDSSSFLNEDEFFDTEQTHVHKAEVDDSGTPMNSKWAAEASSIADEHSKNLAKASRRRKRAGSVISDVSSISESSVRKPRVHSDGYYLSAENLAKLVEEGVMDNSSDEESEDSFHSAVSLSQLKTIEQDLSQELKDTESILAELRAEMKELRRAAVSTDQADHETQKQSCRLEIDRVMAELKTLRAAHRDVQTQGVLLEVEGLLSGENSFYQAQVSVKRASYLLERRKRLAEHTSPSDHNLTFGLRRNLLEISLAVHRANLHYMVDEDTNQTAAFHEKTAIVIGISDVVVVLQRNLGESKVAVSINGVDGNFRAGSNSYVLGDKAFFIGGANYSIFSTALPARYPQYFSSASMEEKFLRCSFELRNLDSSKGGYSTSSKLRVSVSDIEVIPRENVLVAIIAAAIQMKNSLKTLENSSPEPRSITISRGAASQSDISLRFSAIRIHILQHHELVGALALTEFGFRFAKIGANETIKDRLQLDVQCNNIQLVWFDDGDSETAFEVFGKKELYDSLFKVRLRRQLVPESVVGGWVTGERLLVEHESTEPTELLYNAHLGAYCQSFIICIHPRVSRLIRGLQELKGLADTWKRGNATSTKQELPTKRRVRWRGDISVQKSSLLVHTVENFVETETGPSALASLALEASIQQTSRARSGFVIQAKLPEIELLHLPRPREMRVIESFSALILIEAPLRNDYLSNAPVPLSGPECRPWTDAAQWRELESALRIDESCSSVVVSLSSIQVNAGPSTINLLKNATKSVKDFISCGRAKETSPRTTNQDRANSKFFGRKFDVILQGGAVTLYREVSRNSEVMSASDKVMSIDFESIRVSMSSTSMLTSLSLGVAWLAVIDWTSRTGIQTLAGGEKPANKKRVSFSPGLDLVVMTVAKKYSGRERADIDVDCMFGEIKWIPLPSSARALVSFFRSFKNLSQDDKADMPKSDEGKNNNLSDIHLKARKLGRVSFSVQTEMLHLILSSRDIPAYIQDGSRDQISVVTFRLQTAVRGSVSMSALDETTPMENLFARSDNRMAVEEAFMQFIGKRATGPSTAISSEIEMQVQGFQVLRTSIEQNESRPVAFDIKRGREQRITNPISFVLTHHLSSTFFPSEINREEYDVHAAHAVQLSADLVDVLVYISLSTGGLNESIRVTVKPILQALKGSPSPTETSAKVASAQTFKDVLRRAPFVASLQIDGIRVTCVPGGASRLTEAPIIKCSLRQLCGGAAIVPVVSGPDEKMDASITGSRSKNSSKHVMAGAWVHFQLAASYHNRRLVAWEPFVEPWRAELVMGLDLSKVMGLCAVPIVATTEDGSWSDPSERLRRSVTSSAHDLGNSRLYGIGRLLRSAPFQTEGAEMVYDSRLPSILRRDVDLCYLSLASAARREISQAMFPLLKSGSSPPLSLLPGDRPMQWLNRFGYPVEIEERTSPIGLTCHLSDSMPLNINISGALLESLSGYVSDGQAGDLRSLAPHWIRNETGLSVRFAEVLDLERQQMGEKAPKVTLSSGMQAPLMLKRSLSQSCDPHKAYMTMELGSFEDTIDRVSLNSLDKQKGSLSGTFSYNVSSKIPLDTVGVHKFPLEWNLDRRPMATGSGGSTNGTLGWVIVRIALHGGVKMVTIESPLLLKNISDTDLLCEVRDHDGLSVIWSSFIRRESHSCSGLLSVPVDLVSYLHSDSFLFSAIALPGDNIYKDESELTSSDRTQFTPIAPPRPFSPSSFAKGVTGIRNKKFRVVGASPQETSGPCYLNLCSIRIGSITHDHAMKGENDSNASGAKVPESRMLLFRSPLAVYNHLALPIRVQVRLPDLPETSQRMSETSERGDVDVVDREWIDIGILDCGETVMWSGAAASAYIEIRILFVTLDGEAVRQFPGWSSSTFVPPEEDQFLKNTTTKSPATSLEDLKLDDSVDLPLFVSVALTQGFPTRKSSSDDNVKTFSQGLPTAGRVVSLFVPVWIVDGTDLDLQFRSEFNVAGQIDANTISPEPGQLSMKISKSARSLGLGELLEDSGLIHLPSRRSFEVLMIGNEGSPRLQVRRRHSHLNHSLSAWSDPIPLSTERNRFHDTTVSAPIRSAHPNAGESEIKAWDAASQPSALRFRFFRASQAFGGNFGTKLVHVICRYEIINATGRELELIGAFKRSTPTMIEADGKPHPFHFDDSRPVRFRPREFGWIWSGRFNIRPRKSEVTMRLKHKLKGDILLVTVDIQAEKGGTCSIFFRLAQHPPYRLENHTVYPIQYQQSLSLIQWSAQMRLKNRVQDTVILPYHHAEFAWDEPEYGPQSVTLHMADFGDALDDFNGKLLGTFDLDHLAPGTVISLGISSFTGQIGADGPTRVLRISQQATLLHDTEESPPQSGQDIATASSPTSTFTVKLSSGIGISLVDWSPQELVYMRLEDVVLDFIKTGNGDSGSVSVGCITVDNQLWVTPFPVMLRVGSRLTRRKNRRHCALSLTWSRKQGDIDLFEKVEFTTEPMMVNVDGNLVSFLIALAKDVKSIKSSIESKEGQNRSHQSKSRNNELKQLIGINESNMAQSQPQDLQALLVDDLYSAIDYMATSAIASKLRSNYRPPRQRNPTNTGGSPKNSSMAESKRKYYIEHLRISAVTAKISWSGLLPVASSLPRLLRPALTFESLPLFLRPLSISHVYGTSEEHAATVKSHYFSIWRILDLCVGVTTKPTFLIRAVVFTWKEIIATGLEMFGMCLKWPAKLSNLATSASSEPTKSFGGRVYWGLVQPALNHTCTLLERISKGANAGSSMLRYKASRSRASGQLVRSRNPRLFATVDGKHDLLVEYVEGVNAGKALLSRVRTGCYLSEGYAYHIEGARIQRGYSLKSSVDMDTSSAYILMVTFERILLLNGQLNASFCDVVWDCNFHDLIFIESREVTSTHTMVLFWYFLNDSFKTDEDVVAFPANDTVGLDTLRFQGVFIPKALIPQFQSMIGNIRGSLFDSGPQQIISSNV